VKDQFIALVAKYFLALLQNAMVSGITTQKLFMTYRLTDGPSK